jgi:hypothetical protein
MASGDLPDAQVGHEEAKDGRGPGRASQIGTSLEDRGDFRGLPTIPSPWAFAGDEAKVGRPGLGGGDCRRGYVLKEALQVKGEKDRGDEGPDEEGEEEEGACPFASWKTALKGAFGGHGGFPSLPGQAGEASTTL